MGSGNITDVLFSFKAIAASTAFRITITRIAYVDFAKRTKIARAVKLTIGNAATDTGIYVFSFIVHTIFLLERTSSICKLLKDY